ncbi:unnamed protein product, partial [Sphacelaria rigidula]
RWKRRFEKLLDIISSTLSNSAIDAVEQMPGNEELAIEPSMEEVDAASGKLANDQAVEAYNLCDDLFMPGLTEDSATMKCLHSFMLTVWRLEVIDSRIKRRCHHGAVQEKGLAQMRQLPRHLPRVPRGQGASEDSDNSPQQILRIKENPPGSSPRCPTPPVDSRHDVRRA